jgi:choline monooxygenase
MDGPHHHASTYTSEATYAGTRAPVSAAATLIPDAYTSEEFFAIERARVFAASWVAVGCTEQVREPGDAIVTDVAGRSVIVVRGRDGQLRGFYNTCRHRGTRLLDAGACRLGRFIRCPYHSWAYDLDGRCVGTPMFTGSEIPADQRSIFDTSGAVGFDKADYGLMPVAVDRFGPVVLVNLDGQAAPLAEHLGDLPARLAGYRLDQWRLARVVNYEVAANYKLVAENFMEYYHLPWVHPGLVKVSPMESHHRWQGRGMYMGMCTSPIAADDPESGGWSTLPPLGGLGADDAASARFVWLFPNIALNVLPNHLFLIHATPRSPRATHETTYLLTHPDATQGPEAQRAVDDLARFWDTVNREDVAIVERVQRGLDTTPFPGGRMCHRFEEPVHRFQNMVIDHMVGTRRVPTGDGVERAPMFGQPSATAHKR